MKLGFNRLALAAGLIIAVSIVRSHIVQPGAAHRSPSRAKAQTTQRMVGSQHLPLPAITHNEGAQRSQISPQQARLAELQVSLKALRAKPHWQHRSLDEQVALQSQEEELRQVMSDLGMSDRDLDPGVVRDELDFLDATRREIIEPQIRDLRQELATLEDSAAGGAWESEAVDRYKELTEQKLTLLRETLSSEEWAEYVARHSNEAEELRTRPLDLSEDQFKQVAMAEEIFNRQASNASPQELEELRKRRDEALRAALNADDKYADYTRAQDPTYAGHIGVASELGLTRDWSNWLFDVQSRISEEERRLLQTDLSDTDRDVALRQLATEARQLLQQGLGEVYEPWAQSPASLWLSRFDKDSTTSD